ncbi:protein serine/threonine phosphatase 2C [Peniophora sp. CONT]|nr:protein serine/threonine phosphatase 2C [Peniophora sp. CONT]
MYSVVSLSAATSTDHLDALAEVRDFAQTDMGRGPPHRYTYRILSEPTLTNELRRLSAPFVKGRVAGSSLQPCPLQEFQNQDRHYTESWPTPGGSWTFNAVLDGHAGHATVDHAVRFLPVMVRRSLESYLRARRGSFTPNDISNILADAIVQCDHAITNSFVALFPGGPSAMRNMSDEQLQRVLRNPANRITSMRCLHGSTALLSLSDPGGEHVWIANLGDCQAVLATRHHRGRWTASYVSDLHDGDNRAEIQRIQREHPGEREVCKDQRVIGYLGPTRSLGDTWLKLDRVYSQRALLLLRSDWIVDRPETFISRIHSPPYVSSTPDVRHIQLPRSAAGSQARHALLLCSDGLPDLYNARFDTRAEMVAHWVQTIGNALDARSDNAALVLLRDALGGDDARSVSSYLTVEMDERWMDDVTILVQAL